MPDQQDGLDNGLRLQHHQTVLNTISNRAARLIQLNLVAATALIGVVSIGGSGNPDAPSLQAALTNIWGIGGSLLLAGGIICALAVVSYGTFDLPVTHATLPPMMEGSDDSRDIFEQYRKRITKAGRIYQLGQITSLSGLLFMIGGVLTEANSTVFSTVLGLGGDIPLGAFLLTVALLVGIGAVWFDIRRLNGDLPNGRE